jgi:hypothetical protein
LAILSIALITVGLVLSAFAVGAGVVVVGVVGGPMLGLGLACASRSIRERRDTGG